MSPTCWWYLSPRHGGRGLTEQVPLQYQDQYYRHQTIHSTMSLCCQDQAPGPGQNTQSLSHKYKYQSGHWIFMSTADASFIATTILIIRNLKINTQTMNHVALQNRGKYISLKCRHLTMLQNNFISLVLQCEDYYLKAFAYYFGLSLLAISCVLNPHYFYFVHFRIREYNRYSIASYFGGLA